MRFVIVTGMSGAGTPGYREGCYYESKVGEMSFSGNIKGELSTHYARASHCNLAELSAILNMCGEFEENTDGICNFRFHSENLQVARKCFTLLEKTFNIRTDAAVRRSAAKGSSSYFLSFEGETFKALRHTIVQSACCKRAYIRGAFLSAGSMSDPGKAYHFEIVCGSREQAEYLRDMINSFGLEAKIVLRKKNYVAYLKEGSQIVDILNIMEAYVALMELENVRILKEMRNSVNRKVNCETANINKTVSAAVKQMEDIAYIRDTIGFEGLPEGLRDVALTRLSCPEATLKELGSLLGTPVGKSGVNHRLRKLSGIADKLRGQ